MIYQRWMDWNDNNKWKEAWKFVVPLNKIWWHWNNICVQICGIYFHTSNKMKEIKIMEIYTEKAIDKMMSDIKYQTYAMFIKALTYINYTNLLSGFSDFQINISSVIIILLLHFVFFSNFWHYARSYRFINEPLAVIPFALISLETLK